MKDQRSKDAGIILLIIVSLTFLISCAGVYYLLYRSDVEKCCEGFRQYVLDGQEGGKCYYWSFFDHIKGIRGCVVEDLHNVLGHK